MIQDLVYMISGFASTTGGAVCLLFVGALIFMGLKDSKNTNTKGNKSSGNSPSNTEQ